MEAYSSSSSKLSQSFHSSLHSVRKPMAKPWKKPIAPLPPTPPKVYKVDPINFRDLVQKLTGAPEFMSSSNDQPQIQALAPAPALPALHDQQRLQRVAPPPISVGASPLSRAEVSAPLHLASGLDHQKMMTDNGLLFTPNSLGLNLSPSSYNWCAFPILSPGTLSSLG
ncbi:VQ motif-containing protein [Corchorus capsularis]|uniref:VQ motif-containing protein n=1 Tax=Corchorus capsularis TaxID=210143 RepID=A0A1R3GE91_COCAP|nr:VQ motif-containing protein [Corchorus capsularis]